jgi:hypothetical protein
MDIRDQVRDQDEISIRFNGDFNINENIPCHRISSQLVSKFKPSLMDALALNHKLPDFIRLMPGMSGKKYRYFINNLIASIDNPRYLEVGSWKGSTACSAMYGNKCVVTCIDNWSHPGTNNTDFYNNTKLSLSDKVKFTVIENDYRQVDYNEIGKYNVYFFDGPHEEIDQYDGVCVAQNALDNDYILIVDDYNLERVRKGTQDALRDLKQKVLAEITILSSIDGDCPRLHHEKSEWHNGYYIALIQKK